MNVHCEDLDLVPFCVGVEVNDYDLEIRSVLVIHKPPVNTNFPSSISVLATQKGYEKLGYGTSALKVAFLYMKEHCFSRNVRVLADTFDDGRDRCAITFWKKSVSIS